VDLSIKLTMGAIPVIDIIGAVPLREFSAPSVRLALKHLAATCATRTAGMTHAGLTRAIRHAEANEKVRRNVATLVDTPAGQEGRPSKSLTFGQAVALIRAAQPYGLYAYVVLSLLVGVWTEEARALRWDHVDLEGDPDADPPVPPHVDVWRSVRAREVVVLVRRPWPGFQPPMMTSDAEQPRLRAFFRHAGTRRGRPFHLPSVNL
jgi:hypothetical protein